MESPFVSGLLDGTFHLLGEVQPPALEDSLQEADALAEGIAADYVRDGLFYGLVVDDNPDDLERQDVQDFAAVLERHFPGHVVRMLSGKGRSPRENHVWLQKMAHEKPDGVFCAVSGDARPLEKHYVDSVESLRLCREEGLGGLTAGATINVGKYTAPDIAISYTKMGRKLSRGAKFLFCQATWDVRKAQELQWELQMRDATVPVIARILWFSSEEVEKLPAVLPPGVLLPELYQRGLKIEYAKGLKEGRAYQSRCLALLMTGLRRLGFCGALLHGDVTPMDIQSLTTAFQKALEECPDYNSWRNRWKGEMEKTMLPPVASPRYLFANLLKLNHRDPAGVEFEPTSPLDPGKAPFGDRLVSRLLRTADDPAKPQALRHALCKICGVTPNVLFRLVHLGYLPNDRCPKRLTEGACGNVGPKGQCECRNRLCFFRRVLALAAAQGRLDEWAR